MRTRNILFFLLRRIFKYSSFLLRPIEKDLIKRYSTNPSSIPVLFIIGAPRTGSTILYQMITAYLDVSYINNFIFFGREVPFFSFLLNREIFRSSGHLSFHSEYGNTFQGGLGAPSEAGSIWNRWMPGRDNYIQKSDINFNQKHAFQNFITAILNKGQKPFVVKNLYFSQRMKLLREVDLNVKILYIKRDPLYTAQSIYMARKRIYNDPGTWWSVKPINYEQLNDFEVFNQVAAQVYYIERQIEEDLTLFSHEDILRINYEDLSTQIHSIMDKIKEFVHVNPREGKDFDTIPRIKIKNEQKLDDLEFQKLKSAVESIYGKTFS